ncbi:hypothetical protein [Limnoglobus roseus]|uniref:hypothetical protein n=1 Tax=Limnoglobus roseus TaxID=2598579 RepID=UPI0011EAC2D4|nr:hypothetical protein [Limnoglobus roseus]
MPADQLADAKVKRFQDAAVGDGQELAGVDDDVPFGIDGAAELAAEAGQGHGVVAVVLVENAAVDQLAEDGPVGDLGGDAAVADVQVEVPLLRRRSGGRSSW